MRFSIGMALGVVAALLVGASSATAGGPTTTTTTTTTTHTVPGSPVPGASTGLVLAAGEAVTVTATGAVCPYGGSFCPGPDGYPGVDTTSTAFGGFPLPGAPAWGLVARVGTGTWVQVGSGPTEVSGVGALELAFNDDYLSDNSGSFTVTVSTTHVSTCWPGWGYGDKNHTHCGPPGQVGSPASVNAPNGDTGQSGGNGKGKAKGHDKR
jgi:hypothetical protein